MPSSTVAASEVDRINTFFPLLPRLGNRWAARRPWEGRVIAVNAHLTTLTAALLRELALGGGRWLACAANEATTDPNVVELLREEGISVFTGRDLQDRHLATLDQGPDLVADVGFELLATLLDRRPARAADLRGAIEITRSGVNRLRARRLPFGVVNINDGELKFHVENRHGVGEGLWPCITALTGLHLAGRKVLVVGYGPVGQGLCTYARAAGASVEVVERDPIRRLVATYDGFPTTELEAGLARAQIAVCATGQAGAIGLRALGGARDGLVLVNAGHGNDEIDVRAIAAAATEAVELGPHATRWRLPGGPWLTVLGAGNPLNIVLNAGSAEPVLLHFALLGLTLEWIAADAPPPGETVVPRRIEEEVAALALAARG